MIRALLVIVAALVVLALWQRGTLNTAQSQRDAAHVMRDAALAGLEAERATRTQEHEAADRLADIGDKHEEDRRDAAGVSGAVAAAVQSGSLELRDALAGCATDRLSSATASAIERDAQARLRAEIAGAVVQVGRDADDHVSASHAVIAADRQ